MQESLRNDLLTPIFIFITNLGNSGRIWILISALLTIPKKTRRVGILALCALGLSVIIDNMILKNLIARSRPFDVIEGLSCLIQKPHDYSFPSGHTGSSFAAAVVLFMGLEKKYSFTAVVLAALIGFSRIYVGVHYPSDVLCGAIIGSLIAVVVYTIGINLWNKER